MNKISHNLKHLLRHANLSENELARRTGVAQQIINRLLSGENQNPKLATLGALAHYFMVSVSQLIGDDISNGNMVINSTATEQIDVPILNWINLASNPLSEELKRPASKLRVDISGDHVLFGVELNDDSMEPKFSQGTMLVFKATDAFQHGDFALIKQSAELIEFRQIFHKDDRIYKKSLNPTSTDYALNQLNPESQCLGVLMQSITRFALSV